MHRILLSCNSCGGPILGEGAVRLSDIVPWGRALDEHLAMFALSDEDMRKRLLGCGDGPASFNAEATKSGTKIVSVDPLYAHSAGEIEARVEATFDAVVSQARARAHHYVWTRFADPEALGRAPRGDAPLPG
jgi:hypothetical protein